MSLIKTFAAMVVTLGVILICSTMALQAAFPEAASLITNPIQAVEDYKASINSYSNYNDKVLRALEAVESGSTEDLEAAIEELQSTAPTK